MHKCSINGDSLLNALNYLKPIYSTTYCIVIPDLAHYVPQFGKQRAQLFQVARYVSLNPVRAGFSQGHASFKALRRYCSISRSETAGYGTFPDIAKH
jgi:hypothetical protein